MKIVTSQNSQSSMLEKGAQWLKGKSDHKLKVLITGDSHIGTLARGKTLLENENDAQLKKVDLNIRPLGGGHIFPTPFFVDKGEYAEILNPEFQKQFKRLPVLETEQEGDTVYGLSGPLHTTRVWRHPDWVKFVPHHLVNNETPVSEALFHQIILDDCQYLLRLIDIFLRNKKKIFVIEPPKPFKHHYSFTNTRSEVIQYIDDYYRNFIRQELAQRAVPIITVDSDCLDEDGFMLPRYRHHDPKDQHHGNEEFGKLMMKKILDFLTTLDAQ